MSNFAGLIKLTVMYGCELAYRVGHDRDERLLSMSVLGDAGSVV